MSDQEFDDMMRSMGVKRMGSGATGKIAKAKPVARVPKKRPVRPSAKKTVPIPGSRPAGTHVKEIRALKDEIAQLKKTLAQQRETHEAEQAAWATQRVELEGQIVTAQL